MVLKINKYMEWPVMPRVGIDYETVKQTAIKLLSQGIAPSVQKIREVLGTGSNTTIAEHLKVWRGEYANKKIHHLPDNLPKELISAMEVLWQIAMEQASHQLAAIKTDLSEQQEKLRLDKIIQEQTLTKLQTTLDESQKKIEEKVNQSHRLQTEIAVMQERLNYQTDEINVTKNQYESRLNRSYDERNIALEKAENLQLENTRLHQQLAEQSKKHQSLIAEEHTLQEKSEVRWVKLIEQARTETIEQRKRNESIISKQSKQIENLQVALSELQSKYIVQQSSLEKNITTIAVLQEKLNNATNKPLKNIKAKQLKRMEIV
jgi:hypothetical protein